MSASAVAMSGDPPQSSYVYPNTATAPYTNWTYTFPSTYTLSDADVDRIVDRLIERLEARDFKIVHAIRSEEV